MKRFFVMLLISAFCGLGAVACGGDVEQTTDGEGGEATSGGEEGGGDMGGDAAGGDTGGDAAGGDAANPCAGGGENPCGGADMGGQ